MKNSLTAWGVAGRVAVMATITNEPYRRNLRFRGRRLLHGERAVYHVMSRTSCGRRLFGDREKGVFVKQMRRQAAFCGVEVLAYC
ncbi:MAG: hypothetical protein ACLFTU_02665, partial [Puniceicoccaceae bacterium]